MPRLVLLACLATLSTPPGVVRAQDSAPLPPDPVTAAGVAETLVAGTRGHEPHVPGSQGAGIRPSGTPASSPPRLPPSDDPRPSAEPRARGRHLEVSLTERRIWLRDGEAVLFSAPVAVGKPVVLEYEDQVWDFSTPRGKRTVLRKEVNPTWTPPDWHYVELAAIQGWKLVRLHRGAPVRLADGSRVTVRGDRVGRVAPDGSFQAVPAGEEVVFEDTLFIPTPGTVNRHIQGPLGSHKLDLGDGYYIHGTQDADSVGGATTHGCLRMLGADLEHLYGNVAVGTPVFIL